MRILILYFIMFLIEVLFAQNLVDSTFTELRGFEDSLGNTHLFYRKYSLVGNRFSSFYTEHNDVYHLDLATGQDTLFLQDYFYEGFDRTEAIIVLDYEFWQNDPGKYIYCGAYFSIDPTVYISRYDSVNVYLWMGEMQNVEISRQSDSLVYASLNNTLIKSHDGGYTWVEDLNTNNFYILIAMLPFNDQVLFSINPNYILMKSTDGGENFFAVDSTVKWNVYCHQMVFDPDSVHVYAMNYDWTYNKYHLLISKDSGGSWNVVLSESQRISLTVGVEQPGELYFSKGNDIYLSLDFGSTYSIYRQLPRNVVGIHYKTGSNLLYAATTKNIYEISPDSAIPIKSLPLKIEPTTCNLVQRIKLFPNYPNPFNPSTTIVFDLPKTSQVTLKVFNILGEEVATIVSDRLSTGSYKYDWNAGDFASGVYLYRLEAGNYIKTRKMVVIR
jgi:hypothetical protein